MLFLPCDVETHPTAFASEEEGCVRQTTCVRSHVQCSGDGAPCPACVIAWCLLRHKSGKCTTLGRVKGEAAESGADIVQERSVLLV